MNVIVGLDIHVLDPPARAMTLPADIAWVCLCPPEVNPLAMNAGNRSHRSRVLSLLPTDEDV